MVVSDKRLFRELIGKARRAAAYAIRDRDKPKYGEYAYGIIAKSLAKAGDTKAALKLIQKYNDGVYGRELLIEVAGICAENSDLNGMLAAADAISDSYYSNERNEAIVVAVQKFAAKNDLKAAGKLVRMIPVNNATLYIRMLGILARASIVAKAKLASEIEDLIKDAEKLPSWMLRARAYAAIAEALLE